MTNINTLADSCSCAAAPGFAVGAVVELADSPLAGLHWQITNKATARKRKITTVAYTLRLLCPAHHAKLVYAVLRPGNTLVATQQSPQRDTRSPLTVAAVDIVKDTETCAFQVVFTAVTCFFDGRFSAPLPEADTYITHQK